MSIQPDSWIKKMCKEHNMIEPFLEEQVSKGTISKGLSSMGYDVSLSDEYRIFTNVNNSLVDPKNFSDDNFVERKGPHCIIPPNSFVLAKTVEYFRIPKDVLCICVPNKYHKEIIIAALKSKKHVFCEKPISRNLLETLLINSIIKNIISHI